MTLHFRTAADAQGLLRYCYVTDDGLQAPTLRLNAGDHLIIHFKNELPAASPAADGMPANMAGMNMTLVATQAWKCIRGLQWAMTMWHEHTLPREQTSRRSAVRMKSCGPSFSPARSFDYVGEDSCQ